MMRTLLLAILLILLLYLTYIKSSFEYFDNKITGLDYNKCGVACTMIEDCAGYAYNNNMCWISQKPINNKSKNGIYGFEYSENIKRCNKIKPLEDYVIATKDDFLNNASYMCQEGEQSQTAHTLELHTVNKQQTFNTIEELKNEKVLPYKQISIDWPNDILTKVPDYEDIKTAIIEPKETMYVMTRNNDEHLGQYLYNHKCVANIDKKDCLQACINEESCVGTEWNPVYIQKSNNTMYYNVCCPKRQIAKVIPRRKEFENGHYYAKYSVSNEHVIELIKKNVIEVV